MYNINNNYCKNIEGFSAKLSYIIFWPICEFLARVLAHFYMINLYCSLFMFSNICCISTKNFALLIQIDVFTTSLSSLLK